MTPIWAILIGLMGDVNVAGSVYLNYPQLFSARSEATGATLRGSNAEVALKMVVDVSDDVTYGADDVNATVDEYRPGAEQRRLTD